MNNQFPRNDSILAKLIRGDASLRGAIQTTPSSVTLTRDEERKVNQVVEQVISGIDPAAAATEIQETPPVTNQTDSEFPTKENANLFNPDIVLDESQIAAVKGMVTHQYAALIGAAGTGKTTVQKYMLNELIFGDDSDFQLAKLEGNQGLNIAMVAFTGMAVQVMRTALPSWMHPCCKTIHGLLEFKPEEMEAKDGKIARIFVPSRHMLNKLDHEIVIIDEASMVGIDLWEQLLAALRPGTRIYMTGDLNQLPPIIGQPVFAFALGNWPVYELTKVHRQKEAGANRIVEVAHDVLNGRHPVFDKTKDNPDWRVIYQELDASPMKANSQILNILNQLRKRPIDPMDPESRMIYDPYKDRVMTAGNGYDESTASSFVQQTPLNESLSLLIQPPNQEHPRYIIDGGRSHKKFAVNLRVMATKNEAPDKADRVTNGMAGVITNIEQNLHYKGKRDLFGPEDEVRAAVRARIQQTVGTVGSLAALAAVELDFDDDDSEAMRGETEEEVEGGGASSHIVHVTFDNGAERRFSSQAQVDSLQLAFCSTVAKCQGSQFDTAIIICHPAEKGQLSREWLYTAITRASKRVIILGTHYGVSYCLGRQKIKGRNLAEKIERYRAMANEGVKTSYGSLKMNVPLTIEDYNANRDLPKVQMSFGEL